MRSIIPKTHLTLKEAPFETPPAAAPQDKRAISKGADTKSRILPNHAIAYSMAGNDRR
jgi:hypothetical protein